MSFHILVYIFLLFAWSRAGLRYKDRQISVWEFIFWSLLWVSIAVVSALPGLTDVLAAHLGIARGSDVVVYLSIMLMFYLLFRLYVKIGTTERRFSELVRSIAVEDALRKKNSK